MPKQPTLKFSAWIPWEDRHQYECRHMPSVYLLAISSKNLKGWSASYADTSYIGMTTARGGLISRWNQFDRSIQGKEGHSGGITIYRDLGNYKRWKRKLFVAAHPMQCNMHKNTRTANDLVRMGWVAFLEYKALAEYRKLMGKEPKYNTK